LLWRLRWLLRHWRCLLWHWRCLLWRGCARHLWCRIAKHGLLLLVAHLITSTTSINRAEVRQQTACQVSDRLPAWGIPLESARLELEGDGAIEISGVKAGGPLWSYLSYLVVVVGGDTSAKVTPAGARHRGHAVIRQEIRAVGNQRGAKD
jgi:hypothetical protein